MAAKGVADSQLKRHVRMTAEGRPCAAQAAHLCVFHGAPHRQHGLQNPPAEECLQLPAIAHIRHMMQLTTADSTQHSACMLPDMHLAHHRTPAP
jgi:hypothetical protein